MVLASRRKKPIDDAILYSELSKIQPATQQDAAASASSDRVNVVEELKVFQALLADIGSRLATYIPNTQTTYAQDLKTLEDNIRSYIGPSPQFEIPTLKAYEESFLRKIQDIINFNKEAQETIKGAESERMVKNLIEAIAKKFGDGKATLNLSLEKNNWDPALLCVQAALIECDEMPQDSRVALWNSFKNLLPPNKTGDADPKKADTKNDSQSAQANQATQPIWKNSIDKITVFSGSDEIKPEVEKGVANLKNWIANAVDNWIKGTSINVENIARTITDHLSKRYAELVKTTMLTDPVTVQNWVTTAFGEIRKDTNVNLGAMLNTVVLDGIRDALVQCALKLVPNGESISFATALKTELNANLNRLRTPRKDDMDRPENQADAIQRAFDKYAVSGAQGQFLAASANLHDVKALEADVLSAIDVISNDITTGLPKIYAEMALGMAQAVNDARGDYTLFITSYRNAFPTKGENLDAKDGEEAITKATLLVEMAGQLKPFADQRLAIDRQAMANAIALIVSSYEGALNTEYAALKDSKDSYFNALSDYMNSKMLHKVREHEVAAVRQAELQLLSLFR